MYTFLMFIIIFIVVAMLWNEGLWSNAIMLVNVFFAAIVAFNWFEPLADYFDELAPSYTYACDFLALWSLFFVSLLVLRTFTDTVSKYRVRFRMPVEIAGKVVFSLLVGWVMVCFITATLHTAPLAHPPCAGSFATEPTSKSFMGMVAPGRKWLAFMQSRSYGAFSSVDNDAKSPHEIDQGKRVFDPQSEFVLKYGQRRQDLYDHMKANDKMRVRK